MLIEEKENMKIKEGDDLGRGSGKFIGFREGSFVCFYHFDRSEISMRKVEKRVKIYFQDFDDRVKRIDKELDGLISEEWRGEKGSLEVI